MGITTKQIADICGVSRGTVDRALNNRQGIQEETRKRILETAEKMGYRPHLLARSLAKGRTMTIGLVVFDLYNRFFAQLTSAVENEAQKSGYFTYFTLTGKNAEKEKECIQHLAERQVDGIILCSVGEGMAYTQHLKHLNIPVVTVANKVSGLIPFVGIDDFRAMKDAALHIMEMGYEKIIYLSPPLSYQGKMNIHAQRRRFEGFREALRQYGSRYRSFEITGGDYIAALDAQITKKSCKTAVLCSSDIYALEILNRFKAGGAKVPENMGLMGFDNVDILKYVQPALSTVSYPVEEIGTKAVQCLIAQIEGREFRMETLLEHTVIPGESL